ncbi:hypothetical protein MUP35_00850, partial [Patescibacteria group bacterium]|nr:hypothetical protein [Patescibacteria group bacterium]
TLIEKITNDEGLTGKEEDIQFLIIGAESQHRLNSLAKYLKENLDSNLYEVEAKEDKEKISIENGFLLIHKNLESKLGWRIIMYKDPPQEAKKIIQLSYRNNSSIFDLLPKRYRERYLLSIKEYFPRDNHELDSNETERPGSKKIRIKLTTCLGSKGLSALHVMAMEFHNGIIPNSKNGSIITDDDIYRCIVTLTRAKRSCSLITFKEFNKTEGKLIERPSKFLEILPQQNLKKICCKISKGKLVYSS